MAQEILLVQRKKKKKNSLNRLVARHLYSQGKNYFTFCIIFLEGKIEIDTNMPNMRRLISM